MDHILFIQSSADGNLGCFSFRDMEKRAINILYIFAGEHMCTFLLDIHLGEEGLGHRICICHVLMAIYEPFNKDSPQTYIHTKILDES